MILALASEVGTVGKFVSVGLFNTLLDFGLFNLLTSKSIKFSKLKANTCSTTVTMIVSFILQRSLVFGSGGGSPLIQALKFFAVTAFGLYILQNGVIQLFTKTWKWPARWVKVILQTLRLKKFMSEDFVLKNGAKVAATLASLSWNYLMYKRIVFNK